MNTSGHDYAFTYTTGTMRTVIQRLTGETEIIESSRDGDTTTIRRSFDGGYTWKIEIRKPGFWTTLFRMIRS